MQRMVDRSKFANVTTIHINEVGPRDGIQNTDVILTVPERYELIRSLEKTGLQTIEIGSFVNPRVVPSMAGTDELFKLLGNSHKYSVLIPNLKGFDAALTNNVKEICLVLCVTDSMNKKNINKNVSESVKEFKEIIKKSKKTGIRTKCYISVAFYCPFEGKVDKGYVCEITNKIIDFGVDEIVIADTIGQANPMEVKLLFRDLIDTNKSDIFSAHFHDTRALGLANVFSSLDQGITKFDSSIGGLGGCPFAPGSSGNLATEDLVSMLEMMNINTGINLDSLINTRNLASKMTSLNLSGRIL